VLVWIDGKKSITFDCFEAVYGLGRDIGEWLELCDVAEQVLERKGSNRRGDGGFARKGWNVFIGDAGKWLEGVEIGVKYGIIDF